MPRLPEPEVADADALTVSTLEVLGSLWLPWYVRTDRHAVVEDIASELDVARAVTVAEVARAADHLVLRHIHQDPTYGAWSHGERIQHYVTQFGAAGLVEVEARAWTTPEGPVLRGGCHRACAVFNLAPAEWRVKLRLERPPPGLPDAWSGLRTA